MLTFDKKHVQTKKEESKRERKNMKA